MGALRGIDDVAETLGQGIAWAGDTGAAGLARAGVISPESRQAVADWRGRINEDIATGQRGYEEAKPGFAGEAGRIGGQIGGAGPVLGAGGRVLQAMTPGFIAAPAAQIAARVPLAAPIVRGAATGAGANVLTSGTSDTPIGEQAGWGALGGAALGPVGHYLGNAVSSGVQRETADLARLAQTRYKIPIRVDQISENPMVRFGGSAAQRAPFTGLGAHVAQQQGAFNRAVANTFGETADKVTPDVMARARDRIGNVFDTTLPRLEAHLNPNFTQRLQGIADATDYLPQEDGRIVMRHVNDILRQFTGVGPQPAAASRPTGAARVTGAQIQALITKNSPLDRAINGGSSNVQYYAGQLKDALLDAVGQTPTGRAKTAAAYVERLDQFRQARLHYKNMKTVEDLAEKSTTGDMSPALLMGQVRSSFGNMAYGGGGDLANLARIGQRFLKEPPSSGTAERLAMMKLGLAGATGLGGIAAFDPEHFQRDAGLLGAGALAARGGGALMRARWAANAAIRSGQRTTPPVLPGALSAGLPYLAPRQNPLPPPLLPPPSP
jgi:hypothetical protein